MSNATCAHPTAPRRVTYADDSATIVGEECVECEIASLRAERDEAVIVRDMAIRDRDAMAGPSGAHASTLEAAAVELAKERDKALNDASRMSNCRDELRCGACAACLRVYQERDDAKQAAEVAAQALKKALGLLGAPRRHRRTRQGGVTP